MKFLNPLEKFILCMMRLRLDISAIDLADRLQFCKITAADTFLDIIGIVFVKVPLLIIWPERPKLQMSMPMCVKNKFRCKIIKVTTLTSM